MTKPSTGEGKEMAYDPLRKPIKVGVKEGDGPPPGYQWNVDIVDLAFDEAMSFLDGEQYDHLARQVRELAREAEPTRSQTIDVRPVDEFYELRDKGGVLKRINARVFFCLCRATRIIAVIGAFNKKNDGQTPDYVKVLMRYRTRHYLAEYCTE